MTTIRLKSSNDEVFEVDLKVVQMSETLKTMLENMGFEDDGEIISLPKVSSEIMRLIIKWSTYRVDTPPARETEDYSDSDDEFVEHKLVLNQCLSFVFYVFPLYFSMEEVGF